MFLVVFVAIVGRTFTYEIFIFDMSAGYILRVINSGHYEPTVTMNAYICIYVHNFAYTLYNVSETVAPGTPPLGAHRGLTVRSPGWGREICNQIT